MPNRVEWISINTWINRQPNKYLIELAQNRGMMPGQLVTSDRQDLIDYYLDYWPEEEAIIA